MKTYEVKEYGLIIPEIKKKDEKTGFILGSSSRIKGRVINPSHNWTPWISKTEIQHNNRGLDVQACSVFGTLNSVESLEYFLTGVCPNYAERPIAIAGNVTIDGQNPHTICETIRKEQGLVNESVLPFSEDIDSWDKYYSPKPLLRWIYEEGEKWWERYVLGHDWLWGTDVNVSITYKQARLKESLTLGTVSVSVIAWQERNGKFYKNPGDIDTHWVQLLDYKEGEWWKILDSYGDPFIKTLEWNYDFGIAKVFYLNPSITPAQKNIFLRILTKIAQVLGLIQQEIAQLPPKPVIIPDEVDPPEPVKPIVPETMEEMVIRVAQEEGLSEEMKKRIYKTIQCESNFNPKAKNENKDNGGNVLSTDWGICQYNDYYYIGIGRPIPSVQFALNEPEKCVRTMCKEFKAGRASHWSCYKKLYPSG